MPPEMWIAEVEVKMKKTLYDQLQDAVVDFDSAS